MQNLLKISFKRIAHTKMKIYLPCHDVNYVSFGESVISLAHK